MELEWVGGDSELTLIKFIFPSNKRKALLKFGNATREGERER